MIPGAEKKQQSALTHKELEGEVMNGRNASSNAEHSPLKAIALISIALSILSLLVFLSVFALSAHPGNATTPFIAFSAFFSALLIVFLVALLSRSKIVNTLAWQTKNRESLLRLIFTIGFGVLFTGAINVATISFAQSQFNLANHSTFPALELESDSTENPNEYRLSSPIGSASHVSLSANYRCYFRYNNTPCMLEVTHPMTISSGTGSIDFEMREILFRPDCKLIDLEEANAIAIKCIGSRIPNAEFINVERCFEVDFFDFQNQSATYHFSEDGNRIKLAQTTSHYIYENNCGTLVTETWEYEDALKQGLDSLLARFVPSNG